MIARIKIEMGHVSLTTPI